MVCVRDVTQLRQLEAEAEQQKRELQMIGQILAISQEKFDEFVASARRFIADNRKRKLLAMLVERKKKNGEFVDLHEVEIK